LNIVEPIRDTDRIKEIHNYLQVRNSRDALLFSFGIYTGLRISDILNYKVKDCIKRGYSIREQKTGKQKIYDWNPYLKKEIDVYVQGKSPDEYMFKSRKGHNKPITRNRAYEIIKRACNACGEFNVGTHTMRKTFGYFMYKLSRNNIAMLMEIYNHSSERITLRYIGVTREQSNNVIKKIRFF
jgi:integrase